MGRYFYRLVVEDEFLRVQNGPKDVVENFLLVFRFFGLRVGGHEVFGFFRRRWPREAGEVKVLNDFFGRLLLLAQGRDDFSLLNAVVAIFAIEEVQCLAEVRL